MAKLNPYLTFNGNCREAMSFYKECFGGELSLQTFDSAPMKIPAGMEKHILHASLISGELLLMASDAMPGQPPVNGTSVTISVNCHSEEEINRLFNALSKQANITMALEDTFWNARFGMLTDKLGIHWMFNYEKTGNN